MVHGVGREVLETEEFSSWLKSLRDREARARIGARILRARLGNLGDVKSVGGAVYEMRIDHGPGYRVYFAQRGATVLLLLVGGDKSTQARDIKRAQGMASIWLDVS